MYSGYVTLAYLFARAAKQAQLALGGEETPSTEPSSIPRASSISACCRAPALMRK